MNAPDKNKAIMRGEQSREGGIVTTPNTLPATGGVSDAEISEKLTALQIGKCTCLTKTPELQFHDKRCTYRLAVELEQLLAQSRPSSTQSAGVVEPSRVYVCARECDECNHVGINDDHEENATCNTCGWSGPSPKEDLCPQCGSEGTMSAACPKCSGHYSLIAERDLATPPATSGMKEAEGPVAMFMGMRRTPEGTREFWGYVMGANELTEGDQLYRATPVNQDGLVGDAERRLRRMLGEQWCTSQMVTTPYTDDGEFFDGSENPTIDFMNDPVDEIRQKMQTRILSAIRAGRKG